MDSITAAVLTTDDADYIFWRSDLRGLHRDHAICHELGHLLAGHPDLPEFARHPSTRYGDTRTLQRGCDYGAEPERAAETFADVIMGRVVQCAPRKDTPRQRALRGFNDALR